MPPCSNTDERGRCEETSNEDPGGGGDLDGTDRGVLASLGDVLHSLEGEHERLMPLLSSIATETRARKEDPERKKEECETVISAR
jgi:hypothetical protein